jgi:hypothetical protein
MDEQPKIRIVRKGDWTWRGRGENTATVRPVK